MSSLFPILSVFARDTNHLTLSPTLTLKQTQVWDARVSLPTYACQMKCALMREMTKSVAVVLVSREKKKKHIILQKQNSTFALTIFY